MSDRPEREIRERSDRSEREIRERIEATRTRMGETIEQIGDRMNPDRVKAEIKSRAREQIHDMKSNVKQKARDTMRDVEHGVSETGRGIWATIRENPVPAGMVGFGLAWLVANRRSADDGRERLGTYSTGEAVPYRAGYAGARYGTTAPVGRAAGGAWTRDEDVDESHGVGDKASAAMHDAGDRLGDAKDRVGETLGDAKNRVGEVAHDAKNRVGELAHDAQERVGELAHSARDRARQAERRVEASMQENPLVAGAVALAVGAAAGMMIPESRREHELLGRSRDRLLDRASGAVQRASEKLHDSARDAAGDTARKAVDEVWPEDVGARFSEPGRS